MGIDRLRLVHTTHVPSHYTCPSTLHMSLHTTHVPPHYTCSSTHYTCPSTLHMFLHTTHVPPHYTCPSTLHMPLHTTHFPPCSLYFALFLIVMRKHCLVLMCAGNTHIQTSLRSVLQYVLPTHPSYVLRTRDTQPWRDLDNDEVRTYTCPSTHSQCITV